ncbi:MAG: cell division protein ZapD [Proteobacteria bacterium]|nr:cell division protein ZapD [Pseudomonadota bacterium]
MSFNIEAEPAELAEISPTVYEQPLNERMRTFLRLEFLYVQAGYHAESANSWSMRAAVASLLEILAITARSDARNEVLKELERHASLLKDFQTKPGVDAGRLRSLLSNITRLRSDLTTVGGNFMAPLRDSEFLSAIKHRSAIPGGTCDFDLPDYSYWLHRSAQTRTAEFNAWLTTIRPLCDAISELLWLTRENARPKKEMAAGGVHQIQFDRENPCQLVRITLDPHGDLFPEISGNQHRCTIRFLRWTDAAHHPQHVEADVPFVLTLCT